jgi:DNA-binding response OmpR family regulator
MSRVLIADADPALRTAFGLILQKKLGISEMKVVASLSQLQSCLQTWQPDIILLDYSLPGLPEAGGLAAHCSALPKPIIVLSIRAEDGPLALVDGADDSICKSFAPEQVLAIIKRNLPYKSGSLTGCIVVD